MMNDESNNKMNETLESVKAYFRGVRTEWGRISWPQKGQVIAETVAVIVIVAAITIIIYGMDLLFKLLLSLIIK